MRAGSLLFAVGGLSLLGFSSSDSVPSKALIQTIEKAVNERFSDVKTDQFGVSRLGEPYSTHKYKGARLMKSATEAEKNMIAELKRDGWDAVLYTSTPKGMALPISTKPMERINREHRTPGAFHGPVFLTTPSKELPGAGLGFKGDFTKFAQEVQAGKRTDFSYEGWKFLARKVFAEKTCVSCHTDTSGKPVKVGDTIGLYLMGFKKAK